METKRTINSITKHSLDEMQIFSQFEKLELIEESSIKGTLNALYKLEKIIKIPLTDSSTIINYLKAIKCNPSMINKIKEYLFELNKGRMLTGYNVDYPTETNFDNLINKIDRNEINAKTTEKY